MDVQKIPFFKPALPDSKNVFGKMNEIFESGQITNGKFVEKFEKKCENFLNAKNCVALNSCQSGLMLAEKCLSLSGEAIVPSFTFCATINSLIWNNLKPVFVDIDSKTLNLDTEKVEALISGKTSAILGVHVFGNPCSAIELEEIAEKHNIKLVFDAAHAFGAEIGGKKTGGFGNAEVFSFSPTKPLTAIEGGLVCTNDKELAEQIMIGRTYGTENDYISKFSGLSARMEETNAIAGIECLKSFERNFRKREKIAKLYFDELSKLGGISFQEIEKGNKCTFKDFPVIIDRKVFGKNRNFVARQLEKNGIETKKYFFPPMHLQKIFSNTREKKLPVTEFVSSNILCLPIYPLLDENIAKEICKIIAKISKK